MKRLPVFLGMVVAGWTAVSPGSAQVVKIIRQTAVATGAKAPKENADKPADAPPPMLLRWNNGESASGEIAGGTAAELAWRTPLFEEPLPLRWNVLHRLDRLVPDRVPTGPFHFLLRDGSHLYGDLAAVAADTVTIRGERHGEVALRRAEVLTARRIKGEQLLYWGPLGEAGWEAVSTQRVAYESTNTEATLGNVPARRTGPAGALVLPYARRAAVLKLPLPERVDVEFRISGKEKPAFRFCLDGGGKQTLRLETWGDELVLTAGEEFESIRVLQPGDREVALRLCWDRAGRRCQVYTPEGTLLKEWTVPEEKEARAAGVRLENKGRELALEFLRVRTWDGQNLPSGLDLAHPRVRLDDGRNVPGTVRTLSDGQLVVEPIGEGVPGTFPLADVDAIVFATDAPAATPTRTTLTYSDGTLLQGTVLGLDDGRASLQATFAAAPLVAKTGDLRQLFVRDAPPPADGAAEPPFKTLDRITAGDTTLHGRLVTDGGSTPRWVPVGGSRPATPAKTLPLEMVRTLDTAGIKPESTSIFYTTWGDLLPGTLHGLTRAGLEIASPLADIKGLADGQWNAVQFNVSTGASIQGFNAVGWTGGTGKNPALVPKEDKVTLKESDSLFHPTAAQGGEISFAYDTRNFSALKVRFFTEAAGSAKGLGYIMLRNGDEMSTSVENADNDFSERNTTPLPDGPATVRFVIDEKEVRCYVNDTLADRLPFPASKRAGGGLALTATSVWGNSVREVELSKFAATVGPGQSSLQAVDANARAQALTVPRFRKEDPPRHALLAANGDILRGEVEGVTNTQLGFRVGLETLRVPRERVTGLVALQKPAEAAPAAAPEPKTDVNKLLDRQVEERGSYWSSSVSSLIQVALRPAPELTVKMPPEVSSQRGRFRFNNRSVGDTLTAICEQFNLSYRVEGRQVIVESGASKAVSGNVSRVYWLRTAAVADHGPVQEALSSRGILFPNGASAVWQADIHQLTVVNTPENQEKAARLLAQEFGGVQGSPTHWLRLTNGGRLGLAVERFDADAVVGTHPLYGRCRIPFSQVFAVRNTPPEIAPGGAAERWQLAYAPEPVLPTSGGEGSALLDKEAPGFKLALLDGGEFELGKERGHVVVLDFWATWCGPCIKSLPGLIETMAGFPADQVKLVGLNQAEAPEQVKRFLSTRGWKLAVAMDAGQNVAKQYGVDGIPHTVVVGPDGKVAWVKTGYSPDGEAQVAEAVRKLLPPGDGTKASAATGQAAEVEAVAAP